MRTRSISARVFAPVAAATLLLAGAAYGAEAGAKQPEAVRALLRFLSSPSAAPAIAKSGLEPLTSR
jgi:molybdate transport system substrate-binding protein